MEFNNLNQHKAFIKKEAARLGISPKAAYSTYYSRMLLQRLSLTNHGKAVVKGSFSQFVHLGKLSRPVLDIDMASAINNLPLALLYKEMYNASDSIISFDLKAPDHKSKNGIYKIPLIAKVKYPDDKEMSISIPIDFDERRSVFETQFKPVQPLFEGDQKFYVNTASFEEHVADKLESIAHRNKRTDIENSRVKDFYDIYMLHGDNYDPDKFSLYFQAIVMLYGGKLDELDAEFLNKKFIQRHKEIWERMKRKYEFMDMEIEFDEVVYYVKAVLKEQIQRIRNREFTDQAMNLVRNRRR